MQYRTHSTVVVCALISLIATWSPPLASESSYSCEVLKVYDLTDYGLLETSNFDKEMRGSRFTVSRLDGQILGEVLPTLMADKTAVLFPGDGKNSFRAIAYFNVAPSKGPLVQTIDVQEFHVGRRKPFVSFSTGGAGIVTGLCE